MRSKNLQGKNLLYMHTLVLKQKGRQRDWRDWCQEQIYWLLAGGNTSQQTHALLKERQICYIVNS
jgi:hypothetical protein